MLPKGQRFPKAERLCGQTQIKHLFTAGASFFQYPYKVIYTTETLAGPEAFRLPQVLVSVGKRNFKKAVDRNKIKRRTKEAYRLQRKSHLLPQNRPENPIFINKLCLLYTAKKILPYEQLSGAVRAALERLAHIAEQERIAKDNKS